MNLSAPFIRRPVATSLLTVAVLLAGAVSFPHLPLAALPEVEYPTIPVSSQLPGASPETMASAVATPLERMFGRIAGITQMTSISQLGTTNISMQFDLDRNIDAAAPRRAGRHQRRARPVARRICRPIRTGARSNPAESPIMVLALTSDTATAAADVRRGGLDPGAEDFADRPASGRSTSAAARSPPFAPRSIRCMLSKLGIGLDRCARRSTRANAHSPKGALADGNRSYRHLNDNDQLFRAKEYAPLIIAYRNGAPVRLSDVATVVDRRGTPATPGIGERQARPC